MRRTELFQLKPLPKRRDTASQIEEDTGSYFSNMEPQPDQPVFNRKKGESPASRQRCKKT